MLVKKINQRGDTIVEVLICLLVLGTALGFAYSLAGESTQTTRRAQERSEALVYTQSKLEEFKAAYSANPGLYNNDPDSFCSDFSLPSPYRREIPAAQKYRQPPLATPHPAECRSSSGITYMTAITVNNTSATDDDRVFTIRTEWQRIGGGSSEVLTMTYRPRL